MIPNALIGKNARLIVIVAFLSEINKRYPKSVERAYSFESVNLCDSAVLLHRVLSKVRNLYQHPISSYPLKGLASYKLC